MSKICYIDVETTGLDPQKNEIHQLAGILEINGAVAEKFNFKAAPDLWQFVNKKALDVSGVTEDLIRTYPPQNEMRLGLERLLSLYADPKNYFDTVIFTGYNANFDKGFVSSLLGEKVFKSYFGYKVFDIYPLFYGYCLANNLRLKRHRLVDACEYFGIKLNAHDAMEDITATRKLCQILSHKLQE